MDYGIEFVHNGARAGYAELTTLINFMRNGKMLYTMTKLPYGLGLASGMRYDGWSFEQNTRRTGNDVELNIEAARQGGLPFGITARRIMEEEADFEKALEKLYRTPFMSTHYFIMAGSKPYQAAVFNVDRLVGHVGKSSAIRRLSKDTWYTLQTNDDADGPALDIRRPISLQKLTQVSQND